MTTKIGGGAENVLYVFDMICKYMAGFGKYCMRLEHRAFYVKCLML
ncbi:MAG: hypothetical protein MRY64_01835 [Hyphomonadaceae bacterium]|nr:hypothetical protein [Hyphomonadaceae bacterium]